MQQHDKRERDDDTSTPTMQPRPASPVAKTLDEQTQEVDGDNDKQSVAGAGVESSEKSNNNNGSIIPNLLSSGKFPPPPHSPRNRKMSMSPPTISSSPNCNAMVSPGVPAAPPSTPYTPYNNNTNNNNMMLSGADTSSGSGTSAMIPLPLTGAAAVLLPSDSEPALAYYNHHRHRPASPPPLLATATSSSPFASPSQPSDTPSISSSFYKQPPSIPPHSPSTPDPPLGPLNDPHYTALLNQTLHETMQREQSRIATLTHHESTNYTSLTEYQHALSRERRHSTSLSLELAQYKFLTKYTSCNIHSLAEINEEARINSLIKNIDVMKHTMKEDKVRVVMELEREEERIINGLVGRLEGVEREKMLLERQIGSVRGGGSGSGGGMVSGSSMGGGRGRMSGMDGDESRLHAQFERMMASDGAQRQSRSSEQQQQQQDTTRNTRQQQVVQDAQTRAATAAIARQNNTLTGAIANAIPIITATTNDDDVMMMQEDGEEEEEENEDLLGDGQYDHHDPEMEEELANLLKMKEEKESK